MQLGPWRSLYAVAVVVLAAAVIATYVRRRLAGRRTPGRGPTPAGPARLATSPPCAADAGSGSPDREVLALFGGYLPGDTLGRWRILAIHRVDRGGVPVVLAGEDGVPFRLDVLRADADGPQPPGVAGALGVYLMGVPDASGTPEEAGIAAIALASVLDAGAPVPMSLLTLRERIAQQPPRRRDGRPAI